MVSLIAYGGSLNRPLERKRAIAEVSTFCRRNGWGCEPLSRRYSGVLLLSQDEVEGKTASGPGARSIEETHLGIEVKPPGIDSFWIGFDPAGRLADYVDYPAEVVTHPVPGATHYLAHCLSASTGGAPKLHAQVCELLDLLRAKYIRDLEVIDTTEYWKRRDYAALTEALSPMRFAKGYGAALESAAL